MPLHRRQTGFTLVEALVALLLASVGLLGIARLQAAVSSDGGQSAQRLEAQRLLTEKIEEIRALDIAQQLALAPGSDSPNTGSPTVYTRTWSWTGGTGADGRMLRVVVNWNDRAGENRALSASTLVQPPEGRMLAALGQSLTPAQAIRGPVDRHVDIPLKADPLGDGRSKFTIRSQGAFAAEPYITFVIDDASGRVIQRCPSPTEQTAPSVNQLLNGTAACQPYNGVVLAGFMGGANQTLSLRLPLLGGLLGGLTNIDVPYPTRVITSSITGRDSSRQPDCEYSLAYDSNDMILSINGSATYRYACVIPLAANSTGWSGHLEFDGPISLSVAAYICRYQYPNAAGTEANRRNVQSYRNVTQSLFNQNYFLVVNRTCDSLENGLLVEHMQCALPVLGLLFGCRYTGAV